MDLDTALKQLGLLNQTNWAVTELNGWSNKTYLLHHANQHYVLRLPIQADTPWVNRQAEYQHLKAIQPLLITPETHYFDIQTGVQLREYVQGDIISDNPALLTDATLKDVAFLLKKLHTSSCQFEPVNIFDTIEKDYRHIQGQVKDDARYQQLIGYMHKMQTRAGAFQPVPCHMDPTPYNFLDSVRGLLMLDFEYSGACDAAWDLAYFVTYANLNDAQTAAFLSAYAVDDVYAERVALYQPLTQLLQAIWIRLQLSIKHYPVDKKTMLEWEDAALARALGFHSFSNL